MFVNYNCNLLHFTMSDHLFSSSDTPEGLGTHFPFLEPSEM